MALRSFWTAAWLMAGVKTQTFGPNAATLASGQIEAAAAAAGEAWAARDGAAANPAPAARATATRTRAAGRRQRTVIPLVLGLINTAFSAQPLRASPQGDMDDYVPKSRQPS